MSSTSDWFYLDYIRVEALEGIAYDDFNANNLTGGKGWSNDWLSNGSTAIIDSEFPLEGGYCAKITQSGRIEREVDLTGVINPKLVFDSRSVYFENGDEAYIKIDDGTGEQTLLTITPDHCDKVYHQHVIDLSPYAASSSFKIIFEGAMDETLDYWYLDRIRILGDRVSATDNFDSGDFNGGDGFSYAWTVTGAMIDQAQPFSGSACAKFINNASIQRTLDLSGQANKKLEFVARVSTGFDKKDKFSIKIDDGAGWNTVATLTNNDASGYYQAFSIDLSAYAHSATFKIAFEAGIKSSSEDVHIDQVQIV